ncbi:uncharacterized protein TRIREDRAFT_54487 [Trichoderma reesei QM6a]|uniref:Predicted protein n=1 Tax=Hypocrea jecorina (strain QM6a) TaxID=431241 RepID=G0R6X0_HYPJQ|nr:uncharacterized protein TRIREDRAFT_54487 [Trichoderma reesei QM6a]EGR52513.1 predicted protein [Trichoderma reesei QM6a]
MSGTTAIVSEGNFSFTNGVFLAESSGHNKHRRATHEELRTHFASGSDKDHTAHWFEAQLMHYGLPTSKTKSQKLKKEWTKRDRDEKKAAKGASTKAVPKSQASNARKRKADVTVNAAANTGTPAVAASAPKRTKASASSAGDSSPAPRFATKQTARRGPGWRAPSRPEPATRASPSPEPAASSAPRTKQTARRGGGWRASGRPEPARRDSPSPAPSPAPRTKQTARRGRPFVPRGRIESSQTQTSGHGDFATSFDEAPPPYEEDSGSSNRFGGDSLAPLGLLNGRYDISSPYVESEWPMYGSDFSLVLTIVGSSLWGRFDLGVIEGVLYIEERPRASSYSNVPFVWRGREAEGQIFYNERSNRGSLRFIGGGAIEGYFEYQDIQFDGQRLPRQGTRSELDARTLQNEWDSYNEDEYERERVARWSEN